MSGYSNIVFVGGKPHSSDFPLNFIALSETSFDFIDIGTRDAHHR